MDRQFDQKTALVTGASSGLGAEIARELARRGAHVCMAARRRDRLEQLAGEISAAGGAATAIACDVADPPAVKSLVGKVKQDFGQLHLLVNNAGQEYIAPLQVVRPEAARQTLELNVVALAELTRQSLRLLKENSAIVNIASLAGLRGAAGMSLYSASKGAVVSLTQSLALELAPRGIRVNAVAPGIVKTDMTDRMFSKYDPQYVEQLEASYPLGFGRPIDVARAVAFLGSDEASWITGQTLVVDGGCSA
jgi:NAD(P)-dependent dehydrogenase (short-subunit alcohol dehydrogenase family)